MPSATSHPVNADLEKIRLRRQHEKRISPAALRKSANACRSPADAADVVTNLVSSAHRTAQSPPYDPARVRAGSQRMVLGALLVVSGLALGWGVNAASPGLGSLLTQLGALTLILVGVFFLLTGHELRSSDHLPKNLTEKDIDDSVALLEEVNEHQRVPGSALADHLSRALLTADAAVLLFLVTPLVLPNSSPLVHLCIVAAGGILVGKLANDAAASIAQGVRRGQVLAYHHTKESEGTVAGQAVARALRKHYDMAVGGFWVESPGFWAKYSRALPGLVFLVTLTGCLLGLRMVLGGEGDVLAVVIVALLVAGSSAVAIGLKIRGECLVPQVSRAKRIVTRFPSSHQFAREMETDREELRIGLIKARQLLRSAAAPTRHGVGTPRITFDALDLDTVVSKPDGRISSGSASTAPPGGWHVPPSSSVGMSTAHASPVFRRNPHAPRR